MRRAQASARLRRDPDIRWRREEADLPALAAAQRRMLQHAAAVVAPGGRLIYATCSSEPEENEQVAEAFARGARRTSRRSMREPCIRSCRPTPSMRAGTCERNPIATASSASSAPCSNAVT